MRDLKQLQITNWKYIKYFCNDFFALTAVSGNYYNPELGEHPFSKLSGELEKEIHKAWTIMNIGPIYDNIGVRIQHILTKLKEKYTYIQIQK